jgi:hypothetical protein
MSQSQSQSNSPHKHAPQSVARWRTLLDEQVQSSLSVKAFCKQRGLHQSGFYRWKAIIAQLDADTLTQATDTPMSAAFVPVRVVAEVTVDVLLGNGITLRVPLAANPEQVAALVKAVTPC